MRLQNLRTAKGAISVPLGKKSFVRLFLNSAVPIVVKAVKEGVEEQLLALAAERLFGKTLVIDADEIIVEPQKKDGTFTYSVATFPAQDGEPIDDREVPPPPRPENLLAQIREKVRREMGVTRESFLLQNDTGRAGYEIDDDDPGLFEEEIAQMEEYEKSKSEASEASGENLSSEQKENKEAEKKEPKAKKTKAEKTVE